MQRLCDLKYLWRGTDRVRELLTSVRIAADRVGTAYIRSYHPRASDVAETAFCLCTAWLLVKLMLDRHGQLNSAYMS
jgi:hypothetical protein